MAFVISSGARSGVQSRFISIMDPMIIISLFGGGREMQVIYGAWSSIFFALLDCSASSLGRGVVHLSDLSLLSGNCVFKKKKSLLMLEASMSSSIGHSV